MKKTYYLAALTLLLHTAKEPALAQSARPQSAKPAATSASPRTPTTAKPTVRKPTPAPARPAAKPATTATSALKPAAPAPTPTPAAAAPAPTPTPALRPAAPAPARAKYLNAGVGLAAYYGSAIPLGASFEVEVKDNMSVGGSIDYFHYTYRAGGYSWGYTVLYAGARGSYHLAELLNSRNPKLDPYAGATLGYRYVGYNDNTGYGELDGGYNGGLYLGVHGGARYLFSPKLGGFAEVGYGVAALRLGLTAKF